MSETKIYFASDQHLGIPNRKQSIEREKKFIRWLHHIQKDATELFLLGDLFDFWFEYNQVVPKGFVRVLGKLAEITDQGIPIHFFVGNHDLWVKDYFTQELGISVYRNPTDFVREGKKFHIAHGDGLGPKDKGYKFMKKIFSNGLCQWLFHWLIHPNLGIGLGQYLSKSKTVISGHRAPKFMGPSKEWLVQYAKQKQVESHRDYYVFGHRHLPLEINIDEKATYMNIGDWITHFSYAVFDGQQLTLKYWKEDSK